jgi:hypothetical protein
MKVPRSPSSRWRAGFYANELLYVVAMVAGAIIGAVAGAGYYGILGAIGGLVAGALLGIGFSMVLLLAGAVVAKFTLGGSLLPPKRSAPEDKRTN